MHGIGKFHSWNILGSSDYDVWENFIRWFKTQFSSVSQSCLTLCDLMMVKTLTSKVHMKSLINRKRDLNSHLTSRIVCIFLPRLVYIPELSLIPIQVPDFNEQTSVSNGHPRCNSRIYTRFLPQLEKTHETFPSLRDEARVPCIVSRAIAFSQSNT